MWKNCSRIEAAFTRENTTKNTYLTVPNTTLLKKQKKLFKKWENGADRSSIKKEFKTSKVQKILFSATSRHLLTQAFCLKMLARREFFIDLSLLS